MEEGHKNAKKVEGGRKVILFYFLEKYTLNKKIFLEKKI
jgi:hypothetical protein